MRPVFGGFTLNACSKGNVVNPMKLKTLVGNDIFDVMTKAVALAADGQSVAFEFNDNNFVVEANESFQSAAARWKSVVGFEILNHEQSRLRAKEQLENMERETREAIAAASVPTEKEMRDAKAPRPKSPEELLAYIKTLTDRPHDYGTCVYAMSLAATASFNFVASKLGVTGFQASCADMDILRLTRGFEWFGILNYDNLLFPQYCDDDHFPGWETLLEKHREELAKRAKEKLSEVKGPISEKVIAHWKKLAKAT